MAGQSIDYKAVIEDLERKRGLMNSRLDAAIMALRQVLALETSDMQPTLPGVALPVVAAPRSTSYVGMSMMDAAIMHIRSVGHSVPNVVLAKQLEAGGYAHKSKNFPNTLNSIMWRRARTVGDVRKTSRGWDLVVQRNESGERSRPTTD